MKSEEKGHMKKTNNFFYHWFIQIYDSSMPKVGSELSKLEDF